MEGYCWAMWGKDTGHGTFGELQKQTCFDGIRLVSRLHPNGSLVEFSRNFVGSWKSIVFVRVFSEKKQLTPEGGIVFFAWKLTIVIRFNAVKFT